MAQTSKQSRHKMLRHRKGMQEALAAKPCGLMPKTRKWMSNQGGKHGPHV